MRKFFMGAVALAFLLFLPALSSADCSCRMGSNWIYYIGIEYIATSCPPDPPSDDRYYTYINYAVRCPSDTVLNWAFWGDTSTTPRSLGNYLVSQNYRVLRNTSGTHIISVSPDFQGIIAGVNFAGLTPGVYYADLDEYCCHYPSNLYSCSSSLPTDEDNDGWPICFDCNDNDLDLTNNCPPALQKEKNLGRQCKANTLFGNPINVATGNKYHKEEDFVPAGTSPDLSLSIRRHYNSQSEKNGPFGYGWSFSYGLHLEFIDNTIIAWRDDGKAIYFDAASLEAESGARERLQDNGDGSYTLIRVNATKETYDSAGKLVSIADRNDNTATLSYQTNQLASINDTFGRAITFTYNSDGFIETAIASGNLTYQYQYDIDGNLVRIIYPDATSRQYLYEDANDLHNLTGIIDERGIRTGTYAYDVADRAILSSGPDDSKRIDVVYEAENDPDVTQVTNSTGTVTTLQRNIIQGVALAGSISGPGCSSCSNGNTVYSWDEETLQMLSETDGVGNVTTYTYDSRGNMLTKTEGLGTTEERTTSYTYHPDFNLTTGINRESVDSPGNVTTSVMTYDNHGNLTIKEINGFVGGLPQTISTTYSYNGNGQLTNIDGPRTDVDDVITFDYFVNDPAQGLNRGQLMKKTDSLGHEAAYSLYNAFGRPNRIVDANGVITFLQYSDRGLLSSQTTAELTTTYLYDNAGHITEIHPPGSGAMFYFYNDAGLLTKIEDSNGNSITYTYDTEANKAREEVRDAGDTLRKSSDYQYDAYNRLMKIIRLDSLFQEFHYDDAGNQTQRINEAGLATDSAFDSLNRLKTITEPGNTVTTFSYDSHDNLLSVINPEGHATSSLSDDFGRNILTNSPDSGTTSYTHDEAGNLISATDANGITITYEYDPLNRLTAIIFPDSARNVSFSYDEGQYGKGRLTGMSDESSQVSFLYDAHGHLVMEVKQIEGKIYRTEYGYDDSGKLTNMVYPGGRKIIYERDQTGKISAEEAVINGVQHTLAAQISYQPFGPVHYALSGNGLTANRTYNQSYELTAMETGSQVNRTLSYQPGSLVDAITDNLDSGLNQSFVYDDLSRLSNAQGLYGATGFIYYKVGNRQSAAINGDTYSYTYQAASSILQDISGPEQTTFSHDAHGNITGRNNQSFVYNDNNRLQEAWADGVLKARYFYNGFGQRTIKNVNGETIIYHYDLSGNLISEDNPATGQQKDYIYQDNMLLAMVTSDYNQTDDFDINRDGDIDGSDLAASFLPSTAALSLLASSFGKTDCPLPIEQVFYYHTDHLGTPLLMTDQSGAVAWRADYDPFGKALVDPASTLENNLRFPGQYFDAETGLHYNWHRYYDPQSGRYLTTDPIGLAGGINLYSYVQNNPINLIDPKGLYRDVGGGFGVTAGIVSVSASVHTETCCDEQGRKHLRTIQTMCVGWEIGLGLKGSHGSCASLSDDKKPKKCSKMLDDSGWYSGDSGVWGAVVVGRSYSTTSGDAGWKTGLGGGWNIYSGCRNDIIQDVIVGKCCDE